MQILKEKITEFLYRFIENLHYWQELIGAIIGASTPFLLWWFAEKYQQRKIYLERLDYFQRLLADQIDNLVEVKNTIRLFIEKKLPKLVENVRSVESSQYHIGPAFFPLFSVRSLTEEIQGFSTKSGYLDNKLAYSYKLSKDLPLIIDDCRRQFGTLVQTNKEISLAKLNSAQAQKFSYMEEIERFSKTIQEEILKNNIPIYLKILVQTRISLAELRGVGIMRWNLRFNKKFRFFWTRSDYRLSLKATHDNIDDFFKKDFSDHLREIEIIADKNFEDLVKITER